MHIGETSGDIYYFGEIFNAGQGVVIKRETSDESSIIFEKYYDTISPNFNGFGVDSGENYIVILTRSYTNGNTGLAKINATDGSVIMGYYHSTLKANDYFANLEVSLDQNYVYYNPTLSAGDYGCI